MAFDSTTLSVFIASPGDTASARDRSEKAVRLWNASRARACGIVLLPLRWEIDATAEMGSDGQSVINDQLVDNADIVIGLFDSRIGARTSRSLSGTVEEIERSIENGALVHLYFSQMAIDRSADLEQLKAVREYEESVRPRGLVGYYQSLEDLEVKVRGALERDVQRLYDSEKSRSAGRRHRSQSLTVSTDSLPGDASSNALSGVGHSIQVTNAGKDTATDIQFRVDGTGSGDAPACRVADQQRSDLAPGQSIWLKLHTAPGSSKTCTFSITWLELGEVQFLRQRVDLL